MAQADRACAQRELREFTAFQQAVGTSALVLDGDITSPLHGGQVQGGRGLAGSTEEDTQEHTRPQ